MSINQQDFTYVQTLVRQKAGIIIDDGKEYLIELRLKPVAIKNGYENVSGLVQKLKEHSRHNGTHEQVIEALTTNETSFFRDLHPFEVFKNVIVPELIEKNAATRTLKIWSAACSTGQEPYTIAMILRDSFPQLAHWNVSILATDLAGKVLDKARSGVFSQLEVNRGLPALMMVKYFDKQGDSWIIKEPLRKMIVFRQLNLLEHWSGMHTMDIIFIRNVLIYFDVEAKRSILKKVRELMKNDSFLLLGSTESLINVTTDFNNVRHDKTFCFKRKF